VALISAHQCGAPKGAPDSALPRALEEVLRVGCEYVEVDVRRTVDGHFVVRHDAKVITMDGHPRVSTLTLAELSSAVPDVTMYDDVLERIRGHKGLHLDLKFASPRELYGSDGRVCYELAAVQRAVEVLGADAVVVTSGNDRAVADIRAWSAGHEPDLMVGLSLGKSRAGLPWRQQLMGRLSELFPARRVAASGANLVVANHWLALFGVARWTASRGLPLVVWTVDGHRGLSRWLGDPRTWIVTTNEAVRAVELRQRLRRSS
jgi:glycerophosphoryl diester phosphodiesterase